MMGETPPRAGLSSGFDSIERLMQLWLGEMLVADPEDG
jgi:hypothetical protein